MGHLRVSHSFLAAVLILVGLLVAVLVLLGILVLILVIHSDFLRICTCGMAATLV